MNEQMNIIILVSVERSQRYTVDIMDKQKSFQQVNYAWQIRSSI